MQIRNTALKGLGLQSSFQSGALTALKAPTAGGGAAAGAAARATAAAAAAGGGGAAAQRPTFAKMLAAVHKAFPVLRAAPVRSELAVAGGTLSAVIAFLNSCHDEDVKAKAAGTRGSDEAMRDADSDADAAAAPAEDEEMQADDEADDASAAAACPPAALNEGELVFGCSAHVAVLEHGVVRCALHFPPSPSPSFSCTVGPSGQQASQGLQLDISAMFPLRACCVHGGANTC